MVNRQAFIFSLWMGAILAWVSACVPLNAQSPTPTAVPVLSPSPTAPAPVLAEPSSTPEGCLEQRGQVHQVAFDSTALPQFHIYIPACYSADPEARYPVLYLLHGQGYEDDQWLRLGVVEKADHLMNAEDIPSYLIVMPYDKASWRSVEVDDFGDVFVDELIPFIDESYRTLTDVESRAVGGLSRGAGWAIRYGLTRWELFGAIGGHSAAIFYRDYRKLDDWLVKIPTDALPKIYLDIGDRDKERASVLFFVELLVEADIPHEWRLYSGNHDEIYWSAHVEEYLRWYGEVFE